MLIIDTRASPYLKIKHKIQTKHLFDIFLYFRNMCPVLHVRHNIPSVHFDVEKLRI